MDNPRPGKVAVVEEVRGRLDAASATVLTEYRGLSVSEMAALRRALEAAGADYKVYKNTLVRLAVTGGRHEALDQLLTGPTAIAFVSGEISAVAKALRDYARTNPNLVVKGGLHDDGFLSAQDLGVLADLPSRDVLLARIAGGIAAPLRQLAGLIEALPRNLAYGLSALVEQRGGERLETSSAVESDEAPATDEVAQADAAPAEAAQAETTETETTETETTEAVAEAEVPASAEGSSGDATAEATEEEKPEASETTEQ